MKSIKNKNGSPESVHLHFSHTVTCLFLKFMNWSSTFN